MKKNFMSHIIEKESCLPDMVAEMNSSGLPLLFYGAGWYANLLYEIFIRYDLHISDVVVDSLEYKHQTPEFMGFEVKTFDEALDSCDQCNVLVAIAYGYRAFEEIARFENKLKDNKKINRYYYFDGSHFEYNNEVSLEYTFVEDHEDEFQELYNKLSDDCSREILVSYINQRISGGRNGALPLRDLYTDGLYFPEFIDLHEDEVFVDCGAYDGDSINAFIANMGSKKYAHIYAFEPDASSFDKLMKRGYENMTAINKGVYSDGRTLCFSSKGNMSSALCESGDIEVEVDSVDNVLNGKRATYIKFDVEGAELAAIEGAKETIKAFRPKLAIEMCHKNEDLVTLPQKILSYVPEYKLYLRIHTMYSKDLILYAVL